MITRIVVVTGAFFLADLFLGGPRHSIMSGMASGPEDLSNPLYWWRFLASGFAHSPRDARHILFNMAALWFLGRDVEAIYGRSEILRFYLVTIVLGSLAHAFRQFLTLPEEDWGRCMGASGAVTAVIILFICHFPHRQLLLFFVIPVPAWLAGILVIALDIAGTLGAEFEGGEVRVAHDVHLVGAAFGLAYYYFHWNLGRLWPYSLSSLRRGLRPRPKFKVHDPGHPDDLDAEGDRLLDKVNREGLDSLSARERKTLEEYSRRVRERRQ
jgi:membrane associated rhomboid family serine protease